MRSKANRFLSLTHTHILTHIHKLSQILKHTRALTNVLSVTLIHSHSYTFAHTLTLAHSHSRSHTHTLTYTYTHMLSHARTRGRTHVQGLHCSQRENPLPKSAWPPPASAACAAVTLTRCSSDTSQLPVPITGLCTGCPLIWSTHAHLLPSPPLPSTPLLQH